MQISLAGIKTNILKLLRLAKIYANRWWRDKNEQPKNLRLCFWRKNICKYILPIKTNIARPYKGAEKTAENRCKQMAAE